MKISRRFRTALIAAPLALALAACSGEEATTELEGEPIAAIPAPDDSNWTEQVTRTEEGGWLVGNPDAPIKLVEYGSLTCPACAMFSTEGSAQLHSEYIESGRVSFELRSLVRGLPDLILTRLLDCSPESAAVPLADQVWAELIATQGPFDASDQAALQAADQLPPEQRLIGIAQASGLTDWFAARGISRDQAQACLTDIPAIEALGTQLNDQATEDDVNATPTFFLNGQRVDGTSWNNVEAALQSAGARDE